MTANPLEQNWFNHWPSRQMLAWRSPRVANMAAGGKLSFGGRYGHSKHQIQSGLLALWG